MTALSAKRATDSKWLGNKKSYPVAASTVCYDGGMVMINSAGYAVPASAIGGNKGVVGVAVGTADNSSGAAGAVNVVCQSGLYSFTITTGTQANVGDVCYATDDQTVDTVQDAGEPAAGLILEFVSSTEVYVAVGPEYLGSGADAGGVETQTLIASADYSSTGQYLAVKATTTADNIVRCTTAGEAALGILQNAPASGADARVAIIGPCVFQAGTGGVTAGDKLAVEATTSKIVTAAAGDYVIGFALDTVAADATGTMFMLPGGSLSDVTGSALANTKIWIGSASNVAAEFALSGDVTMTAGGAVTIANDAVNEAKTADSDGTSGLYVAKYALALYDFATDGGGSPGAITLTDAVTIPDNAVCELVTYDVLTTCTSAADTATIKLNLVSDGDLSTAIAINDGSNPWDAGVFLASAVTPIAQKTTAARLLQITTATQALTAGKIVFCVRYWVSQ